MPRFVWILLALWCTALAQVQPVEPLLPKAEKQCCGCHGACGMPDCALAPTPVQPAAEPADTLTVARPATLVTALPHALATVKFFALFLPAAPAAADPPPAPLPAPPPASAPLFQQHCSRLI
ncbi:MAG: hypothetical protein ACHQ5A_05960 [Opitutales bacterium]